SDRRRRIGGFTMSRPRDVAAAILIARRSFSSAVREAAEPADCDWRGVDTMARRLLAGGTPQAAPPHGDKRGGNQEHHNSTPERVHVCAEQAQQRPVDTLIGGHE